MRLLYWYTRFLDENGNPRKYHGLDDFELNLSTNAKYHFDADAYEFKQVPHDVPLPKQFWGYKPLYNINAIVGKNGDGKTTIIHMVMDTLQELYDRELKSQNETAFFVEHKGKKVLFYLTGSLTDHRAIKCNFSQIIFTMGRITSHEEFLNVIDRTKLIYITNVLSEEDDARYCTFGNRDHVRESFIYDCSLSGTIRHDAGDNRFNNSRQDILRTYFTKEYYKQVKFVFDITQRQHLQCLKDIGMHVPKNLFITTRNPNKEYQTLFNLSKGVKAQKTISDKIAYRLCTCCFYSFLDNIRRYNYDKEVFLPQFNIKAPKSATYKDFIELFEQFLRGNMQNYLVDWLRDLYGRCSEFINNICENKDMLERFFDSNNSLTILEDGFQFSLTIPVDENLNDDITEWLSKFIECYRRTCVPCFFLDFSWGLSSGENNLLRLFSSLFHVFDSKGKKKSIQNNEKHKTTCDSLILFMDEADLTYHPEWQRKFIQLLAEFLPLEFGNCGIDNLQVILATHSPLLLGDIPSSNVTYLQKGDAKTNDTLNTFGQNIHTILKDSFYLSSTIGAFASKKINMTANKLCDKDHLTIAELRDCKAIIDIVAPGILKSKLIELYESAMIGNDNRLSEGKIRRYTDKLSIDELKTIVQELNMEIERRQND